MSDIPQLKATDVQLAHESLVGPVVGPLVLPGPGAQFSDEISREPFDSTQEVQEFVFEAALGLAKVPGSARPLVDVTELDGGFLTVVYLLDGETMLKNDP